jgi:hypothetical protein
MYFLVQLVCTNIIFLKDWLQIKKRFYKGNKRKQLKKAACKATLTPKIKYNPKLRDHWHCADAAQGGSLPGKWPEESLSSQI